MKTIQIPEEMYDKLMAIAREVETQDNRATSKPYLFQVRTETKQYHRNRDGNHWVFFSEKHGEELGPYSQETIDDYCEGMEIESPEDKIEAGEYSLTEIDDWLDSNGIEVYSYDIKHEYKNAFFTEKSCKEHIRLNKHHYDNPDDFLSYAFRNPEMELIFNFFEHLANPASEKDPVPHLYQKS